MLLIDMCSGQISSRPHTTDFPQMVVKSKGNHLISGQSRLVKYNNLARCVTCILFLGEVDGVFPTNLPECPP